MKKPLSRYWRLWVYWPIYFLWRWARDTEAARFRGYVRRAQECDNAYDALEIVQCLKKEKC